MNRTSLTYCQATPNATFSGTFAGFVSMDEEKASGFFDSKSLRKQICRTLLASNTPIASSGFFDSKSLRKQICRTLLASNTPIASSGFLDSKAQRNSLFADFVSTGKDPRKGWRIPLNEIKYNEQRDEETGYGYFGARYLDHELMTMWLSVDPMADKYPSISPYAYCAWNPVKLVDPDGREWDPASEEKYIKPYKNEINARIDMIVNKRNETGAPDLYSNQLNEYNNILGELDAMGNDSKNVYKIQGDYSFNNKNTFGEVRYGGGTGDKNIININLKGSSKRIFGCMGTLAHELKHAYQFLIGDLGFILDANGNQRSSTNSQELEKQAFTRGDMFESHHVTNDMRMKYNFSLNVDNCILPPTGVYLNMPNRWDGSVYLNPGETLLLNRH